MIPLPLSSADAGGALDNAVILPSDEVVETRSLFDATILNIMFN